MVDCTGILETYRKQLMQCTIEQDTTDKMYEEFCKIIKEEMLSKLKYKVLSNVKNDKVKGKARHKPWWNENLKILWSCLKKFEKNWLYATAEMKQKAKTEMLCAQKQFDKEVKSSKHLYWVKRQEYLHDLCSDTKADFWKEIGKIGIIKERKTKIPLIVKNEEGNLCEEKAEVLKVWKKYFQELLNSENIVQIENPSTDYINHHDIGDVNENITREELIKAINDVNKGKACGVDEIPVEMLNNKACIDFMLEMFNKGFKYGIFPASWRKGVINPVPKGSGKDPQDPKSYRGITVAVSSYKLFCSIINNRLKNWCDENEVLVEEQNGFRTGRSCIDHLHSLVTILDTRLKTRRNTFTAFVDFEKAYDRINRNLLWNKLEALGLNGYVMNTLKSLYDNVSCCVQINGAKSEWFDVNMGLKQGCILSPLLFNLYINDLVKTIKSSNIGIPVGEEIVSILLYADDLVLLAQNETDLQSLLCILEKWCNKWLVNVNCEKSEIVHFRKVSDNRSQICFMYNSKTLNTVDHYKYLGIVLNEFLDLKFTADIVAKSANRALGLLISKCKLSGGLPVKCFKKLYFSMVLPVIHYGSSIWGQKRFSSIDAVHNKACRFIMGVGRYAPNAAVQGDTGLTPPFIDQWISITRYWCRIMNMSCDRINKRIFEWTERLARCNIKNWVWKTKLCYRDNNLNVLLDKTNQLVNRLAVTLIGDVMFKSFVEKWSKDVNRHDSKNNIGGNKLRLYQNIKADFIPEQYLELHIGFSAKSAFAKLRCGVAPINIEIGRYQNIPVSQRWCPFCEHCIEDEVHILTNCDLYIDLREKLYSVISKTDNCFYHLTNKDKALYILSGSICIKECANTCKKILKRRMLFITK